VNAIETFARTAARTRLALVARHRDVVEVLAARIVAADERVIGGGGVRRQCADGDAATGRFDLRELQPGDVDELIRPLDILFHQIEDVRSAREELRLRVSADGASRCVRIRGAYVVKRSHSHPLF
jgi:hypothetical protein